MKNLSILAVAALSLTALTADTARAGRFPRPGVDIATVSAKATRIYKENFVGGQAVVITVRGDGTTDLDLYVLDEDGKVVAKDLGPTDRCLALFVPKTNGKYTIKVVNRSRAFANRYTLRTN